MSANELNEESDDFVTCSVCLIEYDEDIRRPKYLPCHHSLCSCCIKVILSELSQCFADYCKLKLLLFIFTQKIHLNESVCCPICREVWDYPGNSIARLPANTSALHILKLINRRKEELSQRIKITKL